MIGHKLVFFQKLSGNPTHTETYFRVPIHYRKYFKAWLVTADGSTSGHSLQFWSAKTGGCGPPDTWQVFGLSFFVFCMSMDTTTALNTNMPKIGYNLKTHIATENILLMLQTSFSVSNIESQTSITRITCKLTEFK